MAKRSKYISIPLSTKGTTAGSDPKMNMGTLVVENGVWNRRGAIEKRSGFVTASGDGLASAPKYMGLFNENPVAFDKAYAPRTAPEVFNTYIWFPSNMVDVQNISRQNINLYRKSPHYYADVCVRNDIMTIGYLAYNDVDSDYDIICDTFNSSSGMRIDTDTLVNGSAVVDAPKVCAMGSSSCVYYWSSQDLYYRRINADGIIDSSGTKVGGAGLERSSTYLTWDLCVLTRTGSVPYVAIAFVSSSADTLSFATIDASGSLVSASSLARSFQPDRVGVNTLGAQKYCIAWNEISASTDQCYVASFHDSLAEHISASYITQSSQANYKVKSVVPAQYTGNWINTYITVRDRNSKMTEVWDQLTNSGSHNGSVNMVGCRSQFITKPTYTGNSKYVGLYTSGTGSTIYSQPQVVWTNAQYALNGRNLVGLAAVDPSDALGNLPGNYQSTDGYNSLNDDGYYTVVPYITRWWRNEEKSKNQHDAAVGSSVHNFGLTVLSHRDETPNIKTLGTKTSMTIAGGMPMIYHGSNIVEQGFILYPDITNATGAAGSIPAGTYNYKSLYEDLDEAGNIWRSEPSDPYTITLTQGAEVSITASCLPMDTKRDGHTRIVFYRTKVGGTAYFRVGDILNNTDIQSASYLDTSLDTTIGANEPLYTDYQLPNQMPPSYRVSCIWNNTMWVAKREEEDSTLAYGKPIFGTMDFNDTQELYVDPDGGRITALYSFLDKLFIFKEDRIYAIAGNAPAANGMGGNFSYPELINPSIGCIDQNSIVQIPDGIIFLSNTGFWLMGNNVQLTPIGDDVGHFTKKYTYGRGVVLPQKHLAVFFSSHADGKALAYDWLYGKWSVWTGMDALDAVTSDNRIYRLNSTSPYVYIDDNSKYTDDGSHIPLRIITGWFAPSGLGNRARVSRLIIYGENMGNHNLQVRVAYDHDKNWKEPQSYDSSQIQTTEYDDYYGDGLDTTYEDEAYAINFWFHEAECGAIRFEIKDTSGSTAGFAISAIVIEVEPLAGGFQSTNNRRA